MKGVLVDVLIERKLPMCTLIVPCETAILALQLCMGRLKAINLRLQSTELIIVAATARVRTMGSI